MGRYGITSKLVWDGGTNISIPSEMGTPRADQLQGMVREKLSELAGRVCYDPRTECLTKAGWVAFESLPKGVEVATFNRSSRRMEFQEPTEYIRQWHRGKMYRAHTTKVSLFVTPDHELYAGSRSHKTWGLHKAKDLFGKEYAVLRHALYEGCDAEPIVMHGRTYVQANANRHAVGKTVTRKVPDVLIDLHQMAGWAALLGWYISEGSLNFQDGSGPTVTIYQQERNISPIMEAAANCGLQPRVVGVDPRNDVAQIRVGGSTLAFYLLQFGKGSREKRLPAYVFEWPVSLRETLLDALMAGDGTTSKYGVRIYNTISKTLAADVQRLIISLGRPCNINHSECETGTMYRVRETAHREAHVNHHQQQDGWVDYDGEVFCVSVPNRVLVTRRDDKVVLCGNCYDSVGTGRSSADYHKHVKEVGHLSVYEHAHMTVHIKEPIEALVFLNRPGLWVENRFEDGFRVTFNPRNILDWNTWSDSIGVDDKIGEDTTFCVGNLLSYHAEQSYPMLVPPRAHSENDVRFFKARSAVVEPETGEEKWISMFMVGSRGFSHELVRHGDRTGISQRSTRFVQESESDWIDHPLVQEYDKWLSVKDQPSATTFMGKISTLKDMARRIYVDVVDTLQPWLIERGVDKFTARKQARGAARGYLGNALSTELIFSASEDQWKRMLRLRACGPADAEIREAFIQALAALKASRYASDFTNFSTVPASDGLGDVVVEKQS